MKASVTLLLMLPLFACDREARSGVSMRKSKACAMISGATDGGRGNVKTTTSCIKRDEPSK